MIRADRGVILKRVDENNWFYFKGNFEDSEIGLKIKKILSTKNEHPEIDVLAVNLKSKNIIYVHHHGYDAGNFLVNCISLNKSNNFTEQELNEKKNLIIKCLDRNTFFWEDINIGVSGMNPRDLEEFINNDFPVCFKVHYKREVSDALNFWDNIKIITIKNSNFFRVVRNFSENLYKKNELNRKIQSIRGKREKWAKVFSVNDYTYIKNFLQSEKYLRNKSNLKFLKKPIKSFSQLNEQQLQTYVEMIGGDIDEWKNERHEKSFYCWDSIWFFYESETISHIKELYDSLGLEGYDEEFIRLYYNKWIEAMDRVKINNA